VRPANSQLGPAEFSEPQSKRWLLVRGWLDPPRRGLKRRGQKSTACNDSVKQYGQDAKTRPYRRSRSPGSGDLARFSSKEQEKEGFSIPAQLKLLKDYAAAQGLAMAQEYVDVETAKQTGRTAFGEMVAYLKAHPAVPSLPLRYPLRRVSSTCGVTAAPRPAVGTWGCDCTSGLPPCIARS
jgi:Resolvase, N terminal domain